MLLGKMTFILPWLGIKGNPAHLTIARPRYKSLVQSMSYHTEIMNQQHLSLKILVILSCIVLGPLGPNKKLLFRRLKSLAIVKNVNISQGHLSICAWFA